MQPVDERDSSQHVAPDCRGENFWDLDPGFQALLRRYFSPELYEHIAPLLRELGELAGARLDTAATLANEHSPQLHPRNRFGEDEDIIEYHPAYRDMEEIGFGRFAIHALSHKPALGWSTPLPATAKYAFHYLFAQAECGFLCPINVTDTTAYVIDRYGSEALKARYLARLLSNDLEHMFKGAQFMTEKAGGSDAGALETRAVHEGMDAEGLDVWRLYGDKWFASHPTGDVALVLARPEGAAAGTKGLALFAMPHRLDNGKRNHFRIVRLKEKLGTRSLASAEILLEGAVAYLVGNEGGGLKQMMEQVNQSRLSHGVRAAGMMRRCLNEAMTVARHRQAFGKTLIDQPLMRRQLLKIMVPTEQALSMATYTAHVLDSAPGSPLLRLLTPLTKFRSCRDNIQVAAASLEVRGGNGYIEEWPNARLARDAQLGTLWEGTSNVIAIDVVLRSVKRISAQDDWASALNTMLDDTSAVPPELTAELRQLISRTVEAAVKVAAHPEDEKWCRSVTSAMYHVTSAVLLATEGADIGARGGDSRRLLLARMVIEHRLRPFDPLAFTSSSVDDEITKLLLCDDDVPLERATALAAIAFR
jgi:acyl-CoA dehydrogenase